MPGAALLDKDGQVGLGVDPAAFSVAGIGAQSPSVIASQFAAYDENLNRGDTPAANIQPSELGASPTPTPSDNVQQADEGDQQPAGDDNGIHTSDQLAAVFDGVDDADDLFQSITHTVGDRSFTLAEAIDGFIKQPNAEEWETRRSELEVEFTHKAQNLNVTHEAAMKQMASVTTSLRSMLDQDSSPGDMDALLSSDPVAYQAQQLKNQSRKLALANAESETKRLEDTATRERQATVQSFQAEQTRLLQAKFPEWFDPIQGPQVKLKLEAYARTKGFTDSDMSNIEDHRMFLVLKDAALGAELRSKGAQAIKEARDKKLPAPSSKQAARGEIPGKGEKGIQSRAASMQRLQQSGSLEDAAAVFEGIT